jgi:hypothetical protein
MHQWGVGLDLDPHLAKRYFDLAVELDPEEAYFPAKLSLFLLYASSSFSYFQGASNSLLSSFLLLFLPFMLLTGAQEAERCWVSSGTAC